MADEFAIRVEGMTELMRSFREVDRRLPKELQAELKLAANVVKDAAVGIASEHGLAPPGSSGRGMGGLIAGLKTFSTQSAAGVRDTTTRDGFNYPKVYEYGKRGTTDVGPRAFLKPALEQKSETVEAMIGEMFDRLASSEGLGRGGIL